MQKKKETIFDFEIQSQDQCCGINSLRAFPIKLMTATDKLFFPPCGSKQVAADSAVAICKKYLLSSGSGSVLDTRTIGAQGRSINL